MMQAADGATRALHQLVRQGAARLCALALEAELQEFLDFHGNVLLPDGSRAVVRNGYLPERMLQTAVGDIPVRVPRTRDRGNGGAVFSSSLLPPYHSRLRLDSRLPETWLRAFLDAEALSLLRVLLGPQVALLPGAVLARIDAQWKEYAFAARQQALAGVNYLCWWAGTAGGKELTPLLLFIVGMTQNGSHELVAVNAVSAAAERAEQESEWLEVFQGLRQRRLRSGPKLCEAEDLPGFWTALQQSFPGALTEAANDTGRIGIR